MNIAVFLRSFGELEDTHPVIILAKEMKIKVPKSPYNDNTLNRHIQFLFTYLEWSNGKYHNIMKLKNPIQDFTPDKVYLNDQEVNQLENVVLDRPSTGKG